MVKPAELQAGQLWCNKLSTSAAKAAPKLQELISYMATGSPALQAKYLKVIASSSFSLSK